MRRYLIACVAMMGLLLSVQVQAGGGLPFFVNYAPATYEAHNRNFDIVSDGHGRVYVANFEGLLYYDQTEWHVIHAPGIFRVTKLYKGEDGRIWVGGYNLFGYLAAGTNGKLDLQLIFSKENEGFLGEVTDIYEKEGKIHVVASIGTAGLTDDSMDGFVVETVRNSQMEYYDGVPVNRRVDLPDGSTLLALAGRGLVALDDKGREQYTLSEQNGLCNNNVNSIYADSLGYVWGATDNGLFVVDVQTAYTQYRATEGLLGEVQSICHTSEELYVGTLQGLFVKTGDRFEPVPGLSYACWQLQQDPDGNGVYAATAGGLFRVQGRQAVQITGSHTLSVYVGGDGTFYTGEVDGIYHYGPHGHNRLNTIEKATVFCMDDKNRLWTRNIYGQVFCMGVSKTEMTLITPINARGESDSSNNTLYQREGVIYVLSHVGQFRLDSNTGQLVELDLNEGIWTSDNQYPQFVYPEADRRIWLTNNEGKGLHVYAADPSDMQTLNTLVHPVHALSVQAMEVNGPDIWLGGNFGLIHWDTSVNEPDYTVATPEIYIRRITMDGDSVVWGGFGGEHRLNATLPFKHMTFRSGVPDIKLYYSTNLFSTLGMMEYRYRLGAGNEWSAWSTEPSVRFANPRSGKYTFEVMARDRYGRTTEILSLPLTVRYPVFLRWYSIVAYVLVLALGIQQLIRWRMHRLLKEKMRLENIVAQRTSQLRRQKDEIEEKSKKLEVALDDLSKAQYQLIRQEKMATVGTLTKGLVDRILNPMNYVNNFSHMSLGLIKDLKDNLDDDQEQMTPDIYEDSLDALDMLKTNLQKIEEHGLNTTRILKAMEEMLKERGTNLKLTDLAAICRKNMEMLQSYYAKEIAGCHIRVEAPDADVVVVAEVDAEQISKTIMSILANSIYALQKKYQRKPFEPVVRLSVSVDTKSGRASVCIYDNGIGIEASIIDKVFDPFFTTKTTAEAVGVGMYLSREIVLNHGGDISVRSTKDEYTEFTVSLPINHPKKQPQEDKASALDASQPAD